MQQPGHSNAQLLLRLNLPVQIYFTVFIGCALSYHLTFDSITKDFLGWKGESEFLSITTLFFFFIYLCHIQVVAAAKIYMRLYSG